MKRNYYKVFSILLVFCIVSSLTACNFSSGSLSGGSASNNPYATTMVGDSTNSSATSSSGTSSSSTSNTNAGTMICGITDFEPMNFRDASGNWTGFDTELAVAVAEQLGMDIDFQEIEW